LDIFPLKIKINIMKYLKKYENAGFDVDFAVVKIAHHFNENKVSEMLDAENKEWSDGEATQAQKEATSEVVIRHMINWFEREYSKKLEEDQEASLEDALKAHYSVLN